MDNIKGFTTYAFKKRNFIAIWYFEGIVRQNGFDFKKINKLQLPLCAFHHQHGGVHHPPSSIIISLHAASIIRKLHYEIVWFGLESS